MAAPQLRLEVSLNLAGFRTEVQKLTNIAQSEFTPKINVKFNRQTLDTELNNLQAAIKRRVYRVEIGGNIDTLPDKIKALKEQLASLESFKIDLGIGAVKSLSKKDASKIKSDLRAEILGEQTKIYVPVSIKPSITREDVRNFKNTVKSKLTGLFVDVKANVQGGGTGAGLPPDFMKYMAEQGLLGKTASGMTMRMGKDGGDIKQQLNDAVGSAEKIKSIFDGVAQSIATTGKSIVNVQGKRLGLANVPLMAGAMEKKVERSASAIEGTASFDALKSLYPEINKTIVSLAALRGQVQQNTSKLSGFSLIIGLAAFAGVPLAKSIVRLTGSADKFSKLLDELGPRLEAALTKAASNILNTTSSRLLSGGSVAGLLSAGSVAGLLPPAYRGIGPSAGPAGLLPPAYRGIGPSAEPAALLPSLSSAGRSNAIIEALIASTGPRLLPSGGGDDSLGKLAAPRQTKDAVDAILRNYFKVVEAQVKEVFSAPPIKKESLNIFDHLDTEQYFNYLAQARINAENAIKRSIEEAKQVTKRNQIKDAAQSFLRALEEVVRNAERSAFTQSRIAANRSYVQRANIREIGQPLLGGRQVTPPKMLSAATGFYRGAATPPPLPETQAQLFARREREARMRSVLRGVDVMGETPTRAPARYSYANRPAISAGLPGNVFGGRGGGASGGGGVVPPGGFPSDGKLGGKQGPSTFIGAGSSFNRNRDQLNTAFDVAAASTRNFTASQIPLIGGIRNLAGEFGQATKQVLLYGTAYKGLAFLTSLPGQVLNAAKSQQQFNNGLKVATQDTGTFAKELLYVDNVQRAFGLNLETTRTGFTRLYASMAPTGFDSGSIEKLFTGISAATAALQLTPDKAERVIYAFGQMASKGQIMSEELKGQLGDVLPGALAIFSKAAGMSVKEFSKAMEDGEFVGNRFREVFAKVSNELMNRFGTGAQAAGKSLQGLINTVGGDFQRTLESFAPLANAAAQATLGPLTGMLREVSTAAQIAMGEQDRVKKQLEDSRKDVSALRAGGASAKEIKAAETNVAALAAKYEVLNEAARDPAIAQQVKNIESFVAEVQKAATFTMNLAGVIGSVLSPLFTVLGGNLTSVIGNIALLVIGFNAAKLAALVFMGAVSAMRAITGISAAGAASAGVLATAMRLVGVQATGAQVATIGFGVAVKGLLISTGIGALVVLLGAMATAFLSVGDSAKEAADKAKRSIDSMKDAVRTGNVAIIDMELGVSKGAQTEIKSLIKDIEKLTPTAGARYSTKIVLTEELERRAGQFGIKKGASGDAAIKELKKQLGAEESAYRENVLNKADAVRRADQMGLNKPTPGVTPPETPEEDKKKTSLESYESLRDQLAKNFTQAEIDRREAEHQHKIDLIKSEYDLKEARANSFQKEALRFERRMAEITLERQGALLKASNAVLAAQGSVAGGAGGGATSGGKGLGAGIARYITGDPASPFYKADHGGGNYHEHLAFVSRQAAEEAYKKLTSAGIKVTEFKGKSKVGGHTPGSAHYEGLAFDVPASQVPVGQERGLTARVQSILGIGGGGTTVAGAGAARKVPGSEKRDIVADQKAQLEQVKQSVTARQAEAKAIEDAKVALADFVATATPAEEQKLQNDLLKRRTELMMQGYSDSAVDQALKFAEAEYKINEGIAVNKRLVDAKIISQAQADQNTKTMTESLSNYSAALEENTKRLRDNRLVQAMTTLKDRMSMAGAMTPDQELREQIRQRDPDLSPAEQESLFQQEKLVQNAEKLKADMQGIAGAIGDSFGNAFKGVITGSMTAQEALAGFFQSVADSFADMVAKMIAEYLKMALIKGIQSLLNIFAPGGDPGGKAVGTGQGIFTAANGGIATGGFRAFANGGIVTGPTLGLVGEGRYNEAVIPLPDGKSVPVQLSGGDGGNQINSNITVNVSNGQAQSNATGSNSSELGRKIEGAVKQVIVGELRPGGLLASR